nr:MAG TPA: hypothetical protein [Caudoviricetes sp.]
MLAFLVNYPFAHGAVHRWNGRMRLSHLPIFPCFSIFYYILTLKP